MKRIDRLQTRLLAGIAAVVLVGCGHAGDLQPTNGAPRAPAVQDDDGDGVADPLPPPDADDVATARARGDAALARLAALQVVEVGAIVDGMPGEGPNCYSLPCSDEEYAAQVDRLEVLVDVVAAAVEAGPLALTPQTLAAAQEADCSALNADVATSIAALEALNIVDVQGLVGGDASHCYCFGGEDSCVAAVVEKAGLLARVLAASDDVPPALPGATE